MFNDPWNPSSSEVREWAYTASAIEPCQDWDLSLSWVGFGHDFIEYASDANCPNADYFLHVLYFMVGDSVRSKFHSKHKSSVREFINSGNSSKNFKVRLWAQRAAKLIDNIESFDYESWCGGQLAKSAT
jgi:hypothetical protein|tara:strand:+ start:1644 stop:2030 length:387 start_codon:yes stop_codon:yes gene_type:complete